MSIKNKLFLAQVNSLLQQVEAASQNPNETQKAIFYKNIRHGEDTYIGREFSFHAIDSVETFKKVVPIKDKSLYKPYISLIQKNKEHILWDKSEVFFSNGIPLSPEIINYNFYKGFKIALGTYLKNNPYSKILSGKSFIIEGDLNNFENYAEGDLSAILIKNSPFLFKHFISSSRALKTSCKECINHKITSLVYTPSEFFDCAEKLLREGKTPYISDIWPLLEVVFHTTNNISNEDKEYLRSINNKKELTFINNYISPAGFIAFQDKNEANDLLLLLNCGIFYEFLPVQKAKEAIENQDCTTLGIQDVKVGEQYVMVISTAAGLWRYMLNDIISFTSVTPHRIVIMGNLDDYQEPKKEELNEEVKEELENKIEEKEQEKKTITPENTPEEKNTEKVFRIKKHKKVVETTGSLFPDELFG